MINSGIIGFTETQVNPSDSTCKIMERLNFFNMNVNDSENNFFRFSLWM